MTKTLKLEGNLTNNVGICESGNIYTCSQCNSVNFIGTHRYISVQSPIVASFYDSEYFHCYKCGNKNEKSEGTVAARFACPNCQGVNISIREASKIEKDEDGLANIYKYKGDHHVFCSNCDNEYRVVCKIEHSVSKDENGMPNDTFISKYLTTDPPLIDKSKLYS